MKQQAHTKPAHSILDPAERKVHEIRMSTARQLIEAGTSLRKIVSKLDYKHTSSFIRAFKKHFGYTPGYFQHISICANVHDKNFILMEILFSYFEAIRHIRPDLKSAFYNTFKTANYLKGSLLLKEGQITDHIWFLNSGIVRWFYQKNDRKITSWFSMDRQLILEPFSFNERKPSKIYIEALEDCSTLYANFRDITLLSQTYPDFQQTLAFAINQYLKAVAAHSAALLLSNATDRYLYLEEQHPALLERVPAKFLASFINIDVSSFYRVKAKRKEL